MRVGTVHGAGQLKFSFFCCFSCVLLFLNFYTNCLHSAEQNWFASFDLDSQCSIIGRIVKSRQDGIFSSGGLPVLGISDETASWVANNFTPYLENAPIKKFAPAYCSQIGGQGILFSVLDALIPYAPSVKLRMFRALSSLLTALAITAVIAWFYFQFGLAAGLTVLAFALISQWLTVFARSLWWSTWAFYLPMAMLMLYFLAAGKNRFGNYFKLGGVVFFSILLKTIFNGYEYITTTLIMMVVPFVYYSVLDKVGLVAFFSGLFKIALSAGLAIAVSVSILSFQIASISGNYWDGLHTITYSLQKRTHANPGQVPSVYTESLHAPTLPVVLSYLHGGFCGIDSGVFNLNFSETHGRYYLSYACLILLFVAMTILLYLSAKRCAAHSSDRDRALTALVIAAWFSILAPLSWFIIFKSHSYIHVHLNCIVWQMPFTFFGAAITGLAIRNSFARLLSALRWGRTSGGLCR
jgi:hypothetical protein